jgi:hypothetical protein
MATSITTTVVSSNCSVPTDQSATPFAAIPEGMDFATFNDTLVAELFFLGVLGVGEAVNDAQQSTSPDPSEALPRISRLRASLGTHSTGGIAVLAVFWVRTQKSAHLGWESDSQT